MNSCIQAQSETKQRTHMYTHTIWQCNKNRKNVYVFYIHLYCFMRYALFVSSFPFNCFFNSSVSLLLFHPFVSGFLCLSVSISISQCIFHMCFFLCPSQRRYESFVSLFYVQCIQARFQAMDLNATASADILTSEKITKEKREA